MKLPKHSPSLNKSDHKKVLRKKTNLWKNFMYVFGKMAMVLWVTDILCTIICGNFYSIDIKLVLCHYIVTLMVSGVLSMVWVKFHFSSNYRFSLLKLYDSNKVYEN